MASDQKVFTSPQDPDWINKTRTLIVSSRGMTSHQRHFMLSLFALMPHAKKDYKLEKDNVSEQISQLCQTHKTRYFMYFQVKRKINFNLWVGKYPEGPSIKFQLSGIVLNKDIKFQGNSVKGARHILSFDQGMQTEPILKLTKQLLIGAFNVPKMHPKSTAVIDHTLNFTTDKSLITFKNYQIFRQAINKDNDKIELYQIGPRFMMEVNCVLDGVISGQVLYRRTILKKIPKKSKTDPRKNRKIEQIGEINIFGQQ